MKSSENLTANFNYLMTFKIKIAKGRVSGARTTKSFNNRPCAWTFDVVVQTSESPFGADFNKYIFDTYPMLTTATHTNTFSQDDPHVCMYV